MKDMTTMKLSLVAASFALLAAACGTSDSDSLPNVPKPADTTPATTATAAPKRTLVDGAQLPTSPVNLLVDPGFGLVGSPQPGFGAFLAFLESDFSTVTLGATLDSRSPAGFGGAVGLVKPDGATDKSSNPVLVLTTFPGGDGPFHGKVWVSKSAVDGKPVTFGTDAKSIRVSLTDSSPDGDAFDMKPVDGSTKNVGGRTWVLLAVDVAKALPYGGYFVVHTGGGGGQWHLASPEVVAQPLVDALSTKSMSMSIPAQARSKTQVERTAIQKYQSMKPRWVPASRKENASPR